MLNSVVLFHCWDLFTDTENEFSLGNLSLLLNIPIAAVVLTYPGDKNVLHQVILSHIVRIYSHNDKENMPSFSHQHLHRVNGPLRLIYIQHRESKFVWKIGALRQWLGKFTVSLKLHITVTNSVRQKPH